MAWTPISNTVPQYSKNAGGAAAADYYIKFYDDGTTTPISMATDSTGGTLLAKCQLTSLGYPSTDGTAANVFIPHIDQDYKLALFENETDADNNTLANAAWVVDNLSTSSSGAVSNSNGTSRTFSQWFDRQAQVYATVAALVAETELSIGDYVIIRNYTATNESGPMFGEIVAAATGTADGGSFINLTGSNTQFKQHFIGSDIDIRLFGASPDATASANVTAIQATYDYGKNVVIPVTANPFDINATITGSTEYQLTKGGGTLRATAAITMFEHTTERYQRITDNVRLNGNNIATYCYKISFPKCGLSGGQCDQAVTANVWMGHFSTFIDNDSRVITGDGIGVLIQDNVGEVNDIRVRNCIVSGNALHGIRIATVARDGVWLNDINMENNCSTAGGFAHISSVGIEALHMHDIYMENSLNTDADNTFFDFESGISTLTAKNIKMNDSASTTPFDYFFRIATTGGDILRKAELEDIWGAGYGSHLIENGMNTGVNNYLSLKSINTPGETTDTWVTNGTGVDILNPVRTSLAARRVSTNQTFSTATAAIFNEAQGTTTQSSVDIRTLPASYSLTTGVYTVFESGRYKVSGVISVTAPGSGIYATATIKQSASAVYGPFYSEGGDGTKNVSCAFEGTIVCAAGDTLSVDIESSSGSLDMRVNGSSLSIEKIGTNFGQQA